MAIARLPGWSEGRLHRSSVCECEAVTAVKFSTRVENLNVNSLLDLRRHPCGDGYLPGRTLRLPRCRTAATF